MELIDNAQSDDYLFGKGFLPNKVALNRDYVTKKWAKVIKRELGIKADMYSLKHSNLNETSEILDINAAAAQAVHESTAMVLQHYAVNENVASMNGSKKLITLSDQHLYSVSL